jgi:hypothetical protein
MIPVDYGFQRTTFTQKYLYWAKIKKYDNNMKSTHIGGRGLAVQTWQ